MNEAGHSTETGKTQSKENKAEQKGSGASAASNADERALDEQSEKLDAPLPVESLFPPALVPQARVVHPIVWGLQLWIVASLISLLLLGSREALRGAFVGNEIWILWIDRATAQTSQFSALCTTVLLIYLALLSARASRHLFIGVMASLFGVAPTMVVFYAQRIPLPHVLAWIAALSGSLALLLLATQVRRHTAARSVVACGGMTLLATALRTGGLNGDETLFWSRIGGSVAGIFSTLALAFAVGAHLWTHKARPFKGPLFVGAVLLLAATVPASSQPGAPGWALLIGRALRSLAPETVLGVAAPWAISCAVVLVISTMFSRPNSLVQLLSAVLALGCLAPASPLVIAWTTLSGYALVVSCWTPEDQVVRRMNNPKR